MTYIVRRCRTMILFSLAMVWLQPLLFATTYYVDSATGQDTASGTSESSPWRTIARVNSAPLLPGDSVLFASGRVWHEQLIVTHSGTASTPITFGSYGTASPPIIDGADLVTGWKPLAGHTYRAAFRAKAYKGYVDPLDQPATAINPALSLAQVERTPNSLYSDGEYVYLQLADGGDPNDRTIEVSGKRLYNILATSQSHLVFSNLKLVRAARSGFLGNSLVDNARGPRTNEYISLNKLTVFNWGNTLMDVGADGGVAGIYVYGLSLPTQKPQRGWSVTNSSCGIGDVAPVLAYHVSCIDIEATMGALIDHNTVASINALGISASAFYNGDPCTSPRISNNDVSRSQGNIRIAGCPNAVVSNNNIHDSSGYGINLDGDEDASHPEYATNAHLLGNTITNLAPSRDGTLYNGIDCNKGSSDGIADGNIIRQVAGNSITLEGDTFEPHTSGQPCSGWTLRNNIFDASNNTTVRGEAPGRTGPVYIRDIAIPGLKLYNNTYILHANYPSGMTYGFKSASDMEHDLTLTQFRSIAPNSGGITPASR